MKELFEAIRAGDSSRVQRRWWTADPSLAIFAAAIQGDAAAIEELLAGNRSLVIVLSSHDGWTPLHLAAFFGKLDAARLLLNKGAAVNARSTNAMQNMPLHAAAAGKHAEIVAAADRPRRQRQRPPARRLDPAARGGAERRPRARRNPGGRRRRCVSPRRKQSEAARPGAYQGPADDGRFSGSERSGVCSEWIWNRPFLRSRENAQADLDAASTLEAIEAVRVEVLGPQRQARRDQQGIRQAPAGGARAQSASFSMPSSRNSKAQIEARKAALRIRALDARLESEWIDLTAPAPGIRPGSLHPVTQVQQELEDLFVSLGSPSSTAPKSKPNITISTR